MQKLSRRSWLVATVLLVVVAGTGYLVVPVGEARISQATCDKLELGWPAEKVLQLLGDENRDDLTDDDYMQSLASCCREDEDGNRIAVQFERGKGLTEKSFAPTELTFFEVVKGRVSRRVRALWR
jgi:hypothetical protein